LTALLPAGSQERLRVSAREGSLDGIVAGGKQLIALSARVSPAPESSLPPAWFCCSLNF